MTVELRVDPQHARIVEVIDDSMSPTLQPGDRVMVNVADQGLSHGGIFAMWDGRRIILRRIEPIPNTDPGTLRILPDNPEHQAYERTLGEVRIIGRAAWRGGRL